MQAIRVAAIAACCLAGSAAWAQEVRPLGLLDADAAGQIEVHELDLRLAPDLVSATYFLMPSGGASLRTQARLRLPPLDLADPASVPASGATDPLGLSVSVDGRRAAVRLEAKASVNGRDVTAVLAAVGVPALAPPAVLAKALEAVPPARREALQRRGIADWDAGKPAPLWQAEASLAWEQEIPAGRRTKVEMSYRPAGAAPALSAGGGRSGRAGAFAAWCAEGRTASALGRGAGAKGDLRVVRVALGGQAGWAEPIREFRLQLGPLSTGGVAASCFGGLRPRGAGWEAVRRGWVPNEDVEVLFAR